MIEIVDTRSVTAYINGSLARTEQALQKDLDRIQDTGFNTVWIVLPWREACPRPLKDQDDPVTIAVLKRIAAMLAARNMNAIVGLNYFGEGWSPEGIDPKMFLKDPDTYASFERYVTRLMGHLTEHADSVKLLVFTEGSTPGWNDPKRAKELSGLYRRTLGSMPAHLPKDLRSRFAFGYHDCCILSKGYSEGQSPVPTPAPYDFLSFTGYLRTHDLRVVSSELKARTGRLWAVHGGTPLLLGELGVSHCGVPERKQARTLAYMVKWCLNAGIGNNVWQWYPGPQDQDCINQVYGGYSIVRYDGTPRKALKKLKKIYGRKRRRKRKKPSRKSRNVIASIFSFIKSIFGG